MNPFLHEKEYCSIGFIRKTHGFRGDIKIAIDEHFEEDVLNSEFFFIEIEGFKVPFRIVNVDNTRDLVVKLHGIESNNDAANIIGKAIYLLISDIVAAQDYLEDAKNLDNFIDYKICDNLTNTKHLIHEIREFPQQIMAVILIENKELLIPMNDQFIEEIDPDDKIVYMNLPEGILDL